MTEKEAYGHARLAGLNLLSQMRSILGSLNRVSRIVKVLGMVNAADDFMNHPAVIHGCPDLLVEVFGKNGWHARSAMELPRFRAGLRSKSRPFSPSGCWRKFCRTARFRSVVRF